MSEEKKNKVAEFFNKLLTKEQKELFKSEFGEIPTLPVVPTTPVAMTEAKLKDGTVIKYDTPTLVEGTSIVMVVGQDGTELPAPVGDLELEDGTVITIAEGGKLVKVTPVATAPTEPVVQSAAPVESNKLVEALKVLMEGRFAEQAKLIESLTAENVALKAEFNKQSETVNMVSGFFNALMEVPTGEVPNQDNLKPKKGPASYAIAFKETHKK